MKIVTRRALAPALVAALTAVAFLAPAADSTGVEVCKTSTNGSVPKESLMKALDRAMEMGETPAAAKLTKEERRKRQYDIFWKELQANSNAG